MKAIFLLVLLVCSYNCYARSYGKLFEHVAKAVKVARAKDEHQNQIVYDDKEVEAKQDMARTNQFSSLRLTGGADSCQGLLELFVEGQFAQTCDLTLGDEEARALCSDIGCNSVGAQRADPIQFGFSSAINFYVGLGVDCSGDESSVLDCTFRGAVCVTDSPAHAIALDCGGTIGQELRLVGGSSTCEGRLVTLFDGLYGQACNLNTDNNEAMVICRQLGCNPVGAQRVDPVQYGFSNAIGRYHAFGENCAGDESSVSQCAVAGSVCATDSIPHAVAIQCGGQANVEWIWNPSRQ